MKNYSFIQVLNRLYTRFKFLRARKRREREIFASMREGERGSKQAIIESHIYNRSMTCLCVCVFATVLCVKSGRRGEGGEMLMNSNNEGNLTEGDV
jgi:hypothetical protein